MNKQIMYLFVIIGVIFFTVLLLTSKELGPVESQLPEPTSFMPQKEVAGEQAKQYNQEPEMKINKSKAYQAVLTTSVGKMTVALDVVNTPVTANNFIFLSREGFYNNTIFHRVMSGFMIQGGDPLGNGTGGPGYRFKDEAITKDYKRGIVAMANSGPNTNGSQFFIMHQDYDLPKNYVIFGEVIEGLEVVDKIATAKVTSSASGEPSHPVKPVVVKKVEIIEN